MRREISAMLLLVFAAAQTACSSKSDDVKTGPDAPLPEGPCAKEEKIYPSFVDYSADLELTGANGAKVTLVSSAPAPPRAGDNVWTVEVTLPGSEPGGISITVDPFMPEHGHHTTVDPVVSDEGGGRFVVDPVHFQMPGFWDTTITVDTGDLSDEVRFGFCIE
jgi:hypothetical protein